MNRKFVKGQLYQLPQANAKGQRLCVDAISKDHRGEIVCYTYIETGLKGSASTSGAFALELKLIGEIGRKECNTSFYMCWSPSSPTPPRVKHNLLIEAENAAQCLIEQGKTHEVYILQAVKIAKRPTAVMCELSNVLPVSDDVEESAK